VIDIFTGVVHDNCSAFGNSWWRPETPLNPTVTVSGPFIVQSYQSNPCDYSYGWLGHKTLIRTTFYDSLGGVIDASDGVVYDDCRDYYDNYTDSYADQRPQTNMPSSLIELNNNVSYYESIPCDYSYGNSSLIGDITSIRSVYYNESGTQVESSYT
jgi:hypothetical protein